MKGIGDIMKQAQQIQSQLQDAQAEMATMEVQGESGAGMVKVTMNGRYEVKKIDIDPALMGDDRQVLEDLLAAACNATVRKVEQVQAQKMAALTGGLNSPIAGFPS